MESETLTIERAIHGDEAAMRSLWSRHAPHIDAVVRRLVGNDIDAAADIAQEVWIQIFRALPQYRGDSNAQRAAEDASARQDRDGRGGGHGERRAGRGSVADAGDDRERGTKALAGRSRGVHAA